MRLVLLAAVFVHVSVARLHHSQRLIAPTEPVGEPLKKIVNTGPDTGIHYNHYSKHQPGRHICTAQKNITFPVKTKESYCKPIYKKYVERCNNNQLCSGVRLVYERAYRDVVITRTTNYITYICCPGWSQVNNRSHGCNKPQCSVQCQNGGSCTKPDACACLKGFTGRHCEVDVDECKEQKPCDQICHNTFGSYKCECRENFSLQTDGQSCRKKDGDGPGFEAKDLEYELLDKRLFMLETILATRQGITPVASSNEVQNITYNIDNIFQDVISLKTKLNELEDYKNDVFILKNKINQLEKKSSKMEEMLTKYNKTKPCVLTKKLCF